MDAQWPTQLTNAPRRSVCPINVINATFASNAGISVIMTVYYC